MAEIKYGFLRDPAVQASLPNVTQALQTDNALRGMRNTASNALQKSEGYSSSEAYAEVDRELFTSGDNVAEARKILAEIVRRKRSREAVGFVGVGTEGDEDQAPGAMIAVEAVGSKRLERRGAASIFEDMRNEDIADAYEDLFGVSPF